MKILVIDIGGNNIKIRISGRSTTVKVPSGPRLTGRRMIRDVLAAVDGWTFEAVSIGFPGQVKNNRPAVEPKNLGRGWVRVDYAGAFKRPVKIVNDAAMQALGSYHGGRMLFIGLGTGMGAALVVDDVVASLELGHLPYKNGQTFEQHVGERGRKRAGNARWQRTVADVVARLKEALQADYVVIGGGNVKRIDRLPKGAHRGDNANAFRGGVLLWRKAKR